MKLHAQFQVYRSVRLTVIVQTDRQKPHGRSLKLRGVITTFNKRYASCVPVVQYEIAREAVDTRRLTDYPESNGFNNEIHIFRKKMLAETGIKIIGITIHGPSIDRIRRNE
ncbi:hypothetical protein J6590_052913 [Homalodisca vitripennis]|nr:hypothetical protein J6590_052913 [Homalodisca vitripennis]